MKGSIIVSLISSPISSLTVTSEVPQPTTQTGRNYCSPYSQFHPHLRPLSPSSPPFSDSPIRPPLFPPSRLQIGSSKAATYPISPPTPTRLLISKKLVQSLFTSIRQEKQEWLDCLSILCMIDGELIKKRQMIAIPRRFNFFPHLNLKILIILPCPPTFPSNGAIRQRDEEVICGCSLGHSSSLPLAAGEVQIGSHELFDFGRVLGCRSRFDKRHWNLFGALFVFLSGFGPLLLGL